MTHINGSFDFPGQRKVPGIKAVSYTHLDVYKRQEFFPDVSLLVNDKKVSDHHAIIPTLELEKADLSELPVGERNILLLVCRELLCAVAEPYVYEAVTATFTLSLIHI